MFDYWKHNFNYNNENNDIYNIEFMDDYHENLRIESYMPRLSPQEKFFKWMPSYEINQEHEIFKENRKTLIDIFYKHKSLHEFLTPTDKALKIASLDSIEIEKIEELFNYILHDMGLFYEDYTIDPFYQHYFQYYKATTLSYQWHKFPPISSNHVHVRLLLLIDIENSTNEDTMNIFYENTIIKMKSNTVIPLFTSIHPYTIVNKTNNYLLLSYGIQIPIQLYINKFFKKGDSIVNIITNEKILNSRLKMLLNKNESNNANILLRNTEFYIPVALATAYSSNSNNLQMQIIGKSYTCSVPTILESYIRALMQANYTVHYMYHNCILFQSIPHKLIDEQLKNLILNTFAKENITYQSYDINIGICYKDGFYLFQKQNKYNSCKNIILFIENGSTYKNNSYLFYNNYLHTYEEQMYYLLDKMLYGISCVNKESVIFMELIPI